MDDKELRAAIEAIIFAASEPVSLADLAAALSESEERIEQQIGEIRATFDAHVGGFMLERVGGGVRLVSRPELDPYLRRFFARKNEGRLSMAALETLAIIAYRQPVTAPEISELRGVNSSAVIRTLLERRLIRIAGRKNVVGSPFLYRTTREFLLHFGLERIQDLPQLEEFSEILGENVSEELFDLAPLDSAVAPLEESGEMDPSRNEEGTSAESAGPAPSTSPDPSIVAARDEQESAAEPLADEEESAWSGTPAGPTLE